MKQIMAVMDEGPNYVFHLAALACAGFRSDYADAYAGSVSSEDLEVLRKHSGRIDFGFGSGRGGDLAALLVFHPAYLDLDSARAFEEFFALLDEGLLTGDCRGFLDRYSVAHAKLADWTFHVDAGWLAKHAASRDAIRELGVVYVRSFGTYHDEVWPLEAPKMAGVAARLNEHFRDKDIIGKWEDVTRRTFKYPGYRIILCSALKNGPTANSLGYEKNTFYYGDDFGWMVDFISHEVGTHILMEVNKALMASEEYEEYLVYRAYENLARFYNSKVLGKDRLYGMSPQHHCDEFRAAYSEIADREPGMTPERLLRQGVDLFRARYPDLK